MDINELNVPDTATIHLEFPTIGKLYADDDKALPVTIEVYGPSSDVAVSYRRKMMRDVQKRFGKGGMKSLSKIPPEELEEQEVDRMVAMTARVSNLTYKGEAITADSIRKVFEDPKMGWLVDQVKEKLGGWDDFLN